MGSAASALNRLRGNTSLRSQQHDVVAEKCSQTYDVIIPPANQSIDSQAPLSTSDGGKGVRHNNDTFANGDYHDGLRSVAESQGDNGRTTTDDRSHQSMNTRVGRRQTGYTENRLAESASRSSDTDSPSTSASTSSTPSSASTSDQRVSSADIPSSYTRAISPPVSCWSRLTRRARVTPAGCASASTDSSRATCISRTTDSSTLSSPLDEREAEIYFLLASAKEFLERLHEVEERVALLYEASERDLHLPTIQQLLALRHHLYEELLRIQDMLAADDPDLQRLAQYERTHYLVVNVLRHMRAGAVPDPDEQSRPSAWSAASSDPAISGSPEHGQLGEIWHGNYSNLTRHRTSSHTSREVGVQWGSFMTTAEKAIGVGGRQCSTDTGIELDSRASNYQLTSPSEGQAQIQESGKRVRQGDEGEGRLNSEVISGLLNSHAMETRVIRRWQQEERDKQQHRLNLKLANNMARLRQQALHTDLQADFGEVTASQCL